MAMVTDVPAWLDALLEARPRTAPILKRLGVPPTALPPVVRALLQRLERSQIGRRAMDPRITTPSRSGLAHLLTERSSLLAVLCGGLHIATGAGGHLFHAASLRDGRVFGFDDEDAADVIVEAPSLLAWLGEALQNGGDAAVQEAMEDVALDWDEPAPLPPLHDPVLLLPRVRWLAAALGLDLWDDAELARLVCSAPPLARFDSEREDADREPHLALYWLWAQFLLDDRARLMPRLDALRTHEWELVRQSARAIGEMLHDGTTAVDLGSLTPAALLEARERAMLATPEVTARWLRDQIGPPPALLYALARMTPTDALREMVVEGLQRCTRPLVAELLARAASAWMLQEARPALESLIHQRTVFWTHADEQQADTSGMVCVARTFAPAKTPSRSSTSSRQSSTGRKRRTFRRSESSARPVRFSAPC